jgi:hypothetical protein
MRQLQFGFTKNYKKEFGGALLAGKRKSLRPLSTKHPIHLILKTSGKSIFNPGNRKVEKLIRGTAQEFGVKVYDVALNWSHTHLLIYISSRQDYVRFVRAVGCRLEKLGAKFALRPFTRILTWGKDLLGVKSYFEDNEMEGFGLLFRREKVKKKTKSNLRV